MITVRNATHQDIHRLPAIERSAATLFELHSGLTWAASFPAMATKRHQRILPQTTLWVAEADKKSIIGFLHAEPFGEDLHIWQISVKREHQRAGIGTMLTEKAIDYAITKGFHRITLTTFRSVAWNEIFYRKFAFEVANDDLLVGRLARVRKTEIALGLSPQFRCAMILYCKNHHP